MSKFEWPTLTRHPSSFEPDPTPQDVAAPTLEQLAKDAARYRKVRAMNPSEIEQIAWVSISPDDFDEMVDQHTGWPPIATPPYKSPPET